MTLLHILSKREVFKNAKIHVDIYTVGFRYKFLHYKAVLILKIMERREPTKTIWKRSKRSKRTNATKVGDVNYEKANGDILLIWYQQKTRIS